ncbi:prolipoprotein diacylglyceryl transferase [Amnibacterium flavum]|uniref:Phosphatidylglycerol--prolipoprotein diacylglyceryl transferase n=1 Tax=Amnibacterium flavum TaxID=2173173 RepID=A0A2V1HPY1_9MICO|nr:prolipoprotein diacylglyceryl transferase [Amnibacterium flavum]PVZ94381.1 prolipoprotein diacylglyceryl transferase [Amnibacterium flavum]
MVTPLSIPSPPYEFQGIELGIFDIKTYALCILVGIVVAALLTSRRLTKRGAEPGVIIDIALWAVVFGILGARIWHVATHPADYFFVEGRNLIDTLYNIVAIWEGGNAIFGSLVGGAFGIWIASRTTGLRFWSIADALAPGLLFAQAIGRLGNWFNHELFGQPTDLPWGLEIEYSNSAYPIGLAEGTLFHPTFLYEILWNVFGAVLILLIERQWRLQWGKVIALYLIWYGSGRIWFESIRVDPSEVIFGLRSNVWGAILAVALGVIIWIVQTRRHPGIEPGPYRPGKEWVAPGKAVDSVYTASDFEHGDDAESPSDPAKGEGAGAGRPPATSGSASRP